MHATVVYESMFGNTCAVAAAVAAGLADGGTDTELLPVADAPLTMRARTGLLVIGAPTHAAGIPAPRTRTDAGFWAQADDPLTPRVGIREWLDAVHGDARAVRVATFDTRLRRPTKPGSAANAALLELGRRGFTLVAAPESFWVGGMTGPLLPGEVERARAWGVALARTTGARASSAAASASAPASASAVTLDGAPLRAAPMPRPT
ncbi:flavodoxin/nitric oxide synthase [Cellulomonas alba]|uniref:Flavodoxin/nitric oxide synthase n=1 Tax=Cellulomonas alba TaxID=3053467 RepID=A0ABT7SD66_9CELL|nr:flavodoxin/nitric oxide synthase [Cellulomonas alba]MDM7854121.1 flavodoxin/nitric oxide synthase [Cellulomonas alba]